MTDVSIISKTEENILKVARTVFLNYGYEGTKIAKIAHEAQISTSVIHYYFRSKKRLYSKFVFKLIDALFDPYFVDSEKKENNEAIYRFLNLEINYNSDFFFSIVEELFVEDYEMARFVILQWKHFYEIYKNK
jgi:AcrR family transcriptional regulator